MSGARDSLVTSGPGMSLRQAVILDRDNTLLDDPGYLDDPDGIVFFEDVFPSLRRLQDSGYLLLVVTNQSGIGRGYFNEETGMAVNIKLTQVLQSGGIHLAGIYYCRHHPDAGCLCRKPGKLLAERAIRDHGISRSSSWIIGDSLKDIGMGIGAGLRPILLRSGGKPEDDTPQGVTVCPNLNTAVDVIVGRGDS